MAKSKTRLLICLLVGAFLFAACAKTGASPKPSPAAPVLHPSAVPEAYAIELGSIGKGTPKSAAWSADGTRLAVSSTVGITIYSRPDWEVENFIAISSEIGDAVNLVFQADGSSLFFLAGTSKGVIHQVNLLNNEVTKLVENTQSSFGSNLILAPDGNTIAMYRTQRSYSDKDEFPPGLEIRDKQTGAVLHSIYSETDKGSPVNSAAFSLDGKWLAAGGEDNNVRVYDVASGEILMDGSHDSDVQSVAFSPDGKYLVSAGDDAAVRFWDVESGASVYTLMGFPQTITSVSYCSRGHELLIGLKEGSYQKWSLDEKQLPFKKLEAEINIPGSAKISPDGELMLAIQRGKVQIWDLNTGKVEAALPEYTVEIGEMEFSADGSYFAVVDQQSNVVIWRADTGNYSSTFENEVESVSGISFHPSKHFLAVAGRDGQIEEWDLDQNKVIARYEKVEDDSSFNDIQYSPDGSLLAVSTYPSGITIWDTTSGKIHLQLKSTSDKVSNTYIWFDQKQKNIFAIDYNHTITSWSLSTGKLLREVKIAAETYNELIDSAHNRVYMRTNSGNSTMLTAMDVISGEHLFDVDVQNCSNILAIDPAGIIMAAYQNDIISFFHLGSMQVLTKTDTKFNPSKMVFSPDQRFAAVHYGSNENSIAIYNVESLYTRAEPIQNITPPAPVPSPTATPTALPTSLPAGMVDLVPAIVPSTQPGTITKNRIKDVVDLATFGFGGLEKAVWSPDSQYYALIGADIYLYKAGSTKPDRILNIENRPYEVVFSPNSKYLAVHTDSKINLFEVNTGRVLQEWKDYPYTGISFSPDNLYLHVLKTEYDKKQAARSDITLDILTGKLVNTKVITDKNDGLTISPDGSYAMTSSSKAIHIIDPTTRNILYTFERPIGKKGIITDRAISSTGKLMIRYQPTGSMDLKSTIEMWDVSIDAPPSLLWSAEAGTLYLGEESPGYGYSCYAISLDGSLLAASDKNSVVRIWDTVTGKLLKELERGYKIFFSPDGSSLLLVDFNGDARVWNINESRDFSLSVDVKGFSRSGMDKSVQFSGNSLITVSDQKTVTWDLTGLKEINIPADTLYLENVKSGSVFESRGNILASKREDGKIDLFDASNGKLIQTITNKDNEKGNRISVIGISHDEKTMVGAGYEKSFQLWDIPTGSIRKEISNAFPVQQFIFSSDDRLLVGTAGNGNREAQLAIWDSVTGDLLRYYSNTGSLIDIHPDGVTIATAQRDGTFSLVDLNNGQIIWHGKANEKIRDLKFSPDGKILAVVTEKAIEFWDPASQEKLGSFIIQAQDILFSPDGKYIATGLGDGIYHILGIKN